MKKNQRDLESPGHSCPGGATLVKKKKAFLLPCDVQVKQTTGYCWFAFLLPGMFSLPSHEPLWERYNLRNYWHRIGTVGNPFTLSHILFFKKIINYHWELRDTSLFLWPLQVLFGLFIISMFNLILKVCPDTNFKLVSCWIVNGHKVPFKEL